MPVTSEEAAQSRPTTAAVVLAAGKGTRFRSDLAKVLHPAAGRTVLGWVLRALVPLDLDRVVVVVGHQGTAVGEEARAQASAAGLPEPVVVEQTEQRGTGHAVRVAMEAGALDGCDRVVVLPGDVPLLRAEPLRALLEAATGPLSLLVATLDDPTGYGRVVRAPFGGVARIVEERDADAETRALREVNAGIYAFDRRRLAEVLPQLHTDNAQGEEYLTDTVALLAGEGAVAVAVDAVDVAGVNDRLQLSDAATALRRRILDDLTRSGVSVVDPATTYVGADVVVEPDATLLPGTHLEGATRVARGATIGPDSRLVDALVESGATVTYSVVLGAVVGPRATVGPFSYLRPGTRLGERSKAGAFVEMKNAEVGPGAKVPHLSYMGDVEVGAGANVGAGTITCNYDGYAKHRTTIGEGAFIGSDTMLVAPVTVGARAVTGAASAITKDVPDGALAVERNEQRVLPGWADRRAAAAKTRGGADTASATER